MRNLAKLVVDAAERDPDKLAVSAPDGVLTYSQLDDLANQIAAELKTLGVKQGDRVVIWKEKSIGAIAAMQGVLRLGAAYVPIDPLGPVSRAEKIIRSAKPSALVCGQRLQPAAEKHGMPILDFDKVAQISKQSIWTEVDQNDLAYILYTSGSTGEPKGVCISHKNAYAFVDWAVDTLAIGSKDRLSNHAPFHFDLSVLDIYGAFSAGASVHLIPESSAYLPAELTRFVDVHKLTIWYSVPSALSMMLEFGKMKTRSLRTICFAGEPFPIPQLRALRNAFPDAELFNLYGPTETNVCTYYKVEEISSDRVSPVPIGAGCSGNRVWAEDQNGKEVPIGGEGQLMVEGESVMLGYWRQPPQKPVYGTGDLVRRVETDCYEFIGRIDNMVKIRGFRVELGEIEACLATLAPVYECAVAVKGIGIQAKLVAYMVARGEEKPGLLAVKKHCAEALPRYMIVDKVRWVDSLPRNANGKVDKRKLAD